MSVLLQCVFDTEITKSGRLSDIMNKQRYRNIQGLMLFCTLLVLSAAFYFEHSQGLQVCPLCLMQRGCMFLFGFFCLTALCSKTLHQARRIGVIQMVFLLAGLYFAGRQLWLQSLPVESASVCMPGLDTLVHLFSKEQVLKAFLWGTGDCGEVTWRMLGLSMPAWSAMFFLIMFVVSAFVLWAVGLRLSRVESM
jgi:protein dithiol:quinone oxidoreductase